MAVYTAHCVLTGALDVSNEESTETFHQDLGMLKMLGAGKQLLPQLVWNESLSKSKVKIVCEHVMWLTSFVIF